MTTAADDYATEEAFEAYLAGRSVADAGAGVASFAAAVRATATQPGRPNAALAELLANGLLVDQSAPSSRAATSRRRRRFAMFLPALLAKILSAGAVAQAATGAGVAVVIVASAGAAGVLPGPVQDTFSSIVGSTADETTEPADVTSPAPTTDAADPTTTDGTPTVADPTEADPSEADANQSDDNQGPDDGQSFGQWLNGRVEHGEVDGKRVSDWAHEKNDQRRSAASQSAAESAGQSAAPSAPQPEVESGEKHGNGHGSDG